NYISYRAIKIAKKYSKKVFLTAHDVSLINPGKIFIKNKNHIPRVSFREKLRKEKKRYNPLREIAIKHYLKYVDKIFCVSNSLRELLRINKIKNTTTIYNGINVRKWKISLKEIERFKKKHNLINKKVLIFTGRLIEAKGGDELLKSLGIVDKAFSNWRLLVVGKEWAYTEKLKKIASKLKIKDKIIFTGFLNRKEIKTAYNSADISVFPSLCFETFGMSNLEAMACKKPVVSTCFGGPQEVVEDNKTGYLMDPRESSLMAKKILSLFKNPKKQESFGESGYNRAAKVFSLSKQVKKTIGWYEK
ncbi:MAG: glycosyltransferase, partial [Candidatus Portnoybacteria bacterium]|nr:glycosyltransferase [Candidatus Portnoybacteria bacterium]